ncbi:MAG: sodium:proton antiporter [Pseudomonadota bacterium]
MLADLHLTLSLVITLAILLSYLNYRFVKLPSSIAVMSASLLISIVVIVLNWFGISFAKYDLISVVNNLHFRDMLMHFMLGFLLFAGVLSIDMSHLTRKRVEIGVLAIFGTIISAFLIGSIIYFVLLKLGFNLTYPQALIYGALISPTDPIAVLAVFKGIKSLESLSTTLAAESLYNDGIGVVLFLTIYMLAFSSTPPTIGGTVLLFLRQSVGGLVYGLVLGFVVVKLMKTVSDHKITTMLTIGLVFGGYASANFFGFSGLLTMVTGGIMVNNYQRQKTMSVHARQYLNEFWETIDELLNAILFLMIGFEITIIHLSGKLFIATIIAILVVLICRFIAVVLPMSIIGIWKKQMRFTMSILTWGGLRGGLAVALVLSLPSGDVRDVLLPLTYGVVVFSVLVQGLTVKSLINRAHRANHGLASD